jgi:hypothetical protein
MRTWSSEAHNDRIRDAYNRIVLIAAAARSSEGTEQEVVDAIVDLADEAVAALQPIIDSDGHDDEAAEDGAK